MQPGFASSVQRTIAGRPLPGERKCARGQRRVAHRVPCRVRLHEPDSGQSNAVIGQTMNISTNGLALQLPQDVPAGTWVETLVPHVNGDPIFVCGTVVHSRRVLGDEFEIGVEFTGDSPPPVF